MKILLQKYGFCFAFLTIGALPFVSSGQVLDTTTHRISVNGGFGFLMPHRLPMQHLPQSHIQGFELSWERQFNSTYGWHTDYNNPSMGFSFYHSSLGNDAILGKGYAAYGHIKLPIFKSERFSIYTRMGLGLGLTTRRFEVNGNQKNVAMGSYANIFASVKAGMQYQVTPRWDLFLNANFAHFSNTGLRFPNLGINLPSAQLGLGYKLYQQREAIEQMPSIGNQKQKWWHILPSLGLRSASLGDNSIYPAFNLRIDREHEWLKNASLTYGIDAFYNQAYASLYQLKHRSTDNPNLFQLGVQGSYMQRIGKLHIYLLMGIYAVDQTKLNGLFYHRLGTRYYLNNVWNVNFVILSHYAKADHFQFGIGYRFHR